VDLRSGYAYWIINNGLLASYPRLLHDEIADIAVIGAGVTGAAAAYLLSQSGMSVVVVDRRDVASGSTAASTGLLLYETDTSLSDLARLVGIEVGVRAYQIGLEAVDRIEAMCAALGDDCGFARRSCLYLASSRRDAAALAAEYSLRRAHGFDAELLSDAAVKERFGLHARGALYSPGQGELDCYRFAHRLLAAAARNGARVYDRTDVVDLRPAGERTELITADGIVRARHVVCAAGYEATESLKGHLTDLNSTWACATEPIDGLPSWLRDSVVWETDRPYFYLRTTKDGRVIIGGEDSRFSRRHEQPRLLNKKTERLLTRFRRMFPTIAVEAAYTWAGVFSETRDGLPYIGRRRDDSAIHYALGYGGNGITFGVAAAAMICDALTGRPNHDLELFGFARRAPTGPIGTPLAADVDKVT